MGKPEDVPPPEVSAPPPAYSDNALPPYGQPPPGAYAPQQPPPGGYAPQQPHPGGYAPQQPPPGGYASSGQQPVAPQQITVVQGTGNCPKCHIGYRTENYTCCGIALAILFFPLGLICCLLMKESRCSHCGQPL